MSEQPESLPCDVCGDAVPQCQIDDCDDCFNGTHEVGNCICNCCYSVICPKHTARPTCPHKAIDHEVAR